MPQCPACRSEYTEGDRVCVDCGKTLPAPLDGSHDNLVLVHSAPDDESARIVQAALEAAGVPAWLQHPEGAPASGTMPYLAVGWSYGVLVAAGDEAEARTILANAMPTEEELIAEEEADPTTLAEAEARIRKQ